VSALRQTAFYLFVIFWVAALVVFGNYITLPRNNTTATHFDSIVVLGTPTRPNGSPSPEQRERVFEGIREYRRGVAPRIIMTGGPAHNHFVEAHTMAQLAITQGVPASDVFEEPQAQNTIQNIFYSAQILHHHGWSSAEIVSSPNHLGRTALILLTFNQRQPSLSINWSEHPASWPPEYGLTYKAIFYSVEAWRCLELRLRGFPPSFFLPAHA
jgi:uncharacterized SAM-binding protein YcdF (DUF218 family)